MLTMNNFQASDHIDTLYQAFATVSGDGQSVCFTTQDGSNCRAVYQSTAAPGTAMLAIVKRSTATDWILVKVVPTSVTSAQLTQFKGICDSIQLSASEIL